MFLVVSLAATQTKFNVTFNMNTCMRLDTIGPGSMVQIRGNTAPLTWDNSSPLMTNVGGDYWTYTTLFDSGANLEVQFYATDWEGASNTSLTVTKDTVLPLYYYKHGFNNPPFTPTDSVDVWFRMNMAGLLGFDPASQQVGVRGSLNPLQWGPSILLAREGTSFFYSGVIKFHPDTLTAANGSINYKFYVENGAGWESISDRHSVIHKDTTLVWKYYNNQAPNPNPITTKLITFQADIYSLISSGGFVTSTDSLKILVFSGGIIDSGNQKMDEDLIQAGLFITTLKITASLTSNIEYKFKAYPDSRFDNGGGYETGPNRILIWSGRDSTLPVATPTILPHAAPLPYDVTLRFVVDMNGAVDRYTSSTITNLASVWVKGGAAPIANWAGNWTYDDTGSGNLKKLYDDGTHGDETPGDKYYSSEILWPSGTPSGTFEFKFAAGYPGVETNNGGTSYMDNEAGFAQNHVWTFPTTPPTYANLRVKFGTMGTVGVTENKKAIPAVFALRQNYPNPFNPSTSIEYDIPKESFVTLKIFNLLGQEVLTLVNEKQHAGSYTAMFDASKLSTGIYFSRISAGDFISTKKMLLVK